MFVVFDLDGTLALIDHRRHFIDGDARRWDAFYPACVDDAPNWPIINTALALDAQGGHRLEIWSGRSDIVRTETEAWLSEVGLGHLPLQMRQHRDYTPDNELKQSWMQAAGAKPDLVFDDRDKVVAMWRENGIPCAQVAPGAF